MIHHGYSETWVTHPTGCRQCPETVISSLEEPRVHHEFWFQLPHYTRTRRIEAQSLTQLIVYLCSGTSLGADPQAREQERLRHHPKTHYYLCSGTSLGADPQAREQERLRHHHKIHNYLCSGTSLGADSQAVGPS